jgi:hypothetical protein
MPIRQQRRKKDELFGAARPEIIEKALRSAQSRLGLAAALRAYERQ